MKFKRVSLVKVYALCMCLLLICGTVLAGCNSKNEELCKTKVEEFLTLYQQQDGSAGTYLMNRAYDEEISFEGFQGLLAEKITFKVLKAKDNKDECIVTVEINNVDFSEVFKQLIEEVPQDTSQEDILNILKEKLSDESAHIKKFKVEIPVQDINGELKLKLTSDLSNALFGGYNEYLSELTEVETND